MWIRIAGINRTVLGRETRSYRPLSTSWALSEIKYTCKMHQGSVRPLHISSLRAPPRGMLVPGKRPRNVCGCDRVEAGRTFIGHTTPERAA